jgi:hypothetical protein
VAAKIGEGRTTDTTTAVNMAIFKTFFIINNLTPVWRFLQSCLLCLLTGRRQAGDRQATDRKTQFGGFYDIF